MLVKNVPHIFIRWLLHCTGFHKTQTQTLPLPHINVYIYIHTAKPHVKAKWQLDQSTFTTITVNS